MINLNTPIKLPSKIKLYWLMQIILLLFILSIPIISDWPSRFLGLIIFIGLPLYFYLSLYYNSFTFIVEENKITINSGTITKNSKAISFNMVQSIENAQGILYRMFGFFEVNIWTASPEQFNPYKGSTTHKPDGKLVLSVNDGEWLKNFILDKKSK